jgi:hypothetical protein
VFCAAKVICTVPKDLEAKDVYDLFRHSFYSDTSSDEELTKAIDQWCKEIENIARTKHRWLKGAHYLFIFSSMITLIIAVVAIRT